MPVVVELAAHLPFLLTVSPLFGAAMTWLNGWRGEGAAKRAAVANSTLTLAVAAALIVRSFLDSGGDAAVRMASVFHGGTAGTSAGVTFTWTFAVDGLSLLPLAGIALIGWIAVILADRCVAAGKTACLVELLIGQGLALSLFAAQDFVMFLVGCEAWAWWAFFAVGRQGGPLRRPAAHRLRVTLAASHAAWGLAGIGCAVCHAWIQADVHNRAASVSWIYAEMFARLARWIAGNETAFHAWTVFQPWVLSLWLIGMIVRWPLVPWHGWWSDMTAEARPPIAALCGTTLLLQCGYVLLRFVIPCFPPGGAGWAMLLATWASLGACYFGLLAITRRDGRRLASDLSLLSMQAILIGILAGNVDVALAAWQFAVIAAFALAASLLSASEDRLDGMAKTAPASIRRRTLRALCLGLLSATPCFTIVSGRFVTDLWELRRLGIPNAALLAAGVLGSWAALREILRAGFPSIETRWHDPPRSPSIVVNDKRAEDSLAVRPTRDVNGSEWLIAVLVATALSMALAPASWSPAVRPTIETLYDPFAHRDHAQSDASTRSVAVTVRKPAGGAAAHVSESSTAPLAWLVCGAVLIVAAHGTRLARWLPAAAVAAIVVGVIIEPFAAAKSESRMLLWSFAVMGMVAAAAPRSPSSTTGKGEAATWLIQLSGLGWAVATRDLLLAGLAWELAGLAQSLRMGHSGETPDRRARERMRRIVSSMCFWLGLVLSLFVAGTTDVDDVGARLMETAPRNEEGLVVALGSRIGMAALVLLFSGIGIRSGLLPWSLGCATSDREGIVSLLEDWTDRLFGVFLLALVATGFQQAYGGPVTVMLTIAGAATALWGGLSTLGELRAVPLLRQLLACQAGGLVLLVAAAAASGSMTDASLDRFRSPVASGGLLGSSGLVVALAVCGIAALMYRLEATRQGELFLDHYLGLFVKRRGEALLLVALLLSLTAAWPFAGFWFKWLEWVGLVMSPQRHGADVVQPQIVLVMGGVLAAAATILQTNALARWFRSIAFDPPMGAFHISGGGWVMALVLLVVVLSLAAGIAPNWQFAAIGIEG